MIRAVLLASATATRAPVSPLADWKHSSIVQRNPATAASSGMSVEHPNIGDASHFRLPRGSAKQWDWIWQSAWRGGAVTTLFKMRSGPKAIELGWRAPVNLILLRAAKRGLQDKGRYRSAEFLQEGWEGSLAYFSAFAGMTPVASATATAWVRFIQCSLCRAVSRCAFTLPNDMLRISAAS